MAYFNAENKLSNCIGCFSTLGQIIANNQDFNIPGDLIDYNTGSNLDSLLSGQCQIFLTTAMEFTWFVEQRDIIYAPPDSASGIPLVSFGEKKVYPAKVTGLNLPLIANTFHTSIPVTVRWRDELIRHGSLAASFDVQSGNFRPGFGQLILSDLNRPLKSATVQTNNLGLPSLTSDTKFAIQNGLTGPLGRLMSIASYVNPILAKQYDDSKNKKKKKSLNEQTYQDPPQYPTYTQYQTSGGYGG